MEGVLDKGSNTLTGLQGLAVWKIYSQTTILNETQGTCGAARVFYLLCVQFDPDTSFS